MVNVDINALVEQTPSIASPGNASTTSRGSRGSRGSTSSRARDGTTGSARSVTAATTPAPVPKPLVKPASPGYYHLPPSDSSITGPAQYPVQPYPQHVGRHYHYPPMQHAPYGPMSAPDPRYGPPPMSAAPWPGVNNKRLAPPHPAESPAKKKQSKWTPDEDASIIELRGNGMKWEDISKHLPGRSAISCRLRFQNYLERRTEWDDEKKNKLARLYERFKKDMWEKISKEMQLPWRAAEAMHWQLGEDDMARRANVSVFHLAGQAQQSQSNGMSDRVPSVSPPALIVDAVAYSHTHNHSLPQMSMPQQQAVSPHPARLTARRNSTSTSPVGPSPLRRRADSARSVPAGFAARRTLLPPVGELVGQPPMPSSSRYTLPPVGAMNDPYRR